MRWYYEVLGERAPEEEGNVIDLTKVVTDVHIYDADYFDQEGYLQDRDVGGELPQALQAVLSEEQESQFVFKGSEVEFISLMEEHGIEPLPVGD